MAEDGRSAISVDDPQLALSSQAKSPANLAGLGVSGVNNPLLFQLTPQRSCRPTRPVPKRVHDAGSGVVPVLSPLPEMSVSPLAIMVEPLKKPLPVLMVS